MGEVGKAIFEVLSSKYLTCGYDPLHAPTYPEGKFDMIHICFPFSPTFADTVNMYRDQSLEEGGLVVVHATVPIGTCDSIGAVHSPVRGKHPNLTEGVRKFYKFFGGQRSLDAAQVFIDLKIKAIATPDARNTEAMKLWDTTIYGLNIVIMKHIHAYCVEKGLDFNVVYSLANRSYNEGYSALRSPEYTKYVLEYTPGKIGGHCVIPNARLLESELADWLIQQNETLS